MKWIISRLRRVRQTNRYTGQTERTEEVTERQRRPSTKMHRDKESQQDDVLPYPNHSASQRRHLQKCTHQSTQLISGLYPRPSLDTNLSKRSINTFCVSHVIFQKIHTATRADFPLLTEDCKTAHLPELKDWHVWTWVLVPTHLSLRATAALKEQRISPNILHCHHS